MINLELSKELNPFLIYDDVRKRYTMSSLNSKLTIETNIPKSGRYMICVKYNSINTPNLRLKVNGQLYDNNFCRSKTCSLDYIITINYKNGPYNFNKGKNNLELLCAGRFPEIYNIYMEEYVPLPGIVYQYKPSDFIIIRNFNVYGGFYWNLNNILVGLISCDIYKKIPVICMDAGFYLNNTDLEPTMIKYCDNWFSYYFEDPVKIPACFYKYLVSTKKKVPCSPGTIKMNRPDFVFSYNRKTFSIFNKVKRHKEMLNKYIKLHPNIELYIDKIKESVFDQKDENLKYIGIHYRGTDKIAEDSAPEEHPIHYEHNKIYDVVKNKKEELEKDGNSVYIVITTDENPFLKFMIEKFGEKVLYYKDALRSEINTSGMNENFEKIVPRDKKIDISNLDNDEKKKYNLRDTLINNSLHIGFKDKSNYRKGLDCLIDAKILDRCDVYFKSKGNFSLFCKYFNTNENLEIYDLNDIFTGNIVPEVNNNEEKDVEKIEEQVELLENNEEEQIQSVELVEQVNVEVEEKINEQIEPKEVVDNKSIDN
jgi:hypothetical protein